MEDMNKEIQQSEESIVATEQTANKSNKDAIMERLQKMFPDVDEETMYGNFMEFMDDMERASSAQSMLNDKLTQYPKAGLMLADMMDGRHPAVAIKRHFGDEMDIEEGSEEYEALLTAERERLADEETSGAMKAEYEQNLIESAEAVKTFKDEKGLDDEGFQDFVESAVELTADLLSGKLNATLLNILWKGKNYDTDIANETGIAEQRGLVAGRNEKIEERKRKLAGDGLPNVSSSSIKTKTPIPEPRGSVWDA
jgi:hypothetical protein